MLAHEIRGRVIAKAGSIEAAAAALGVNRTALSQVINYLRATEHIRAKLKAKYGIRFNDGDSKPASKTTYTIKARSAKKATKKKRRAAK